MKSTLFRVSVLAVALCALGMIPGRLAAQTDYSNNRATSMLSIGLGFQGGASGTTEAPEGRKVPPIFAWRFGVNATYPLNSTIGAVLDFGLDSRGAKSRNENEDDIYTISRINYFTLTPGFRFSAFHIAMNFGFPMSQTITAKGGPNSPEVTIDASDGAFDQLAVMLEPRLGAVITLMDEEVGWLGLTISGGFPINTVTDIDGDEGHLYSGHLGLTWQFGIPGTQR